jgi:hypothetical protein
MPDSNSSDGFLAKLAGRTVVLDLASRYVCIGTLTSSDALYLTLENADMHDLRDTSTTREVYVLDAKRHGINSNRKQVSVRREEVVAFSALDDVME